MEVVIKLGEPIKVSVVMKPTMPQEIIVTINRPSNLTQPKADVEVTIDSVQKAI